MAKHFLEPLKIYMLASGLLLLACAPANEQTRWMNIAKKIAEDKMNPMSEFVARQLAQGKKPNRLIREKSPYLLQHAFNPVDWHPWGEEAFALARSQNKPIFLSVGYSTCHWCHVMEHESFENPAIADIMNKHFVCIKVDREERPDVDRVYMSAVQALTGSGGWPMSVFLTPDLKPFYGGTYFPAESKYGRIGFRDLLLKINEIWESQRDKVLESADQITSLLQQHLATSVLDSGNITQGVLDDLFHAFVQSYDAKYGGFSNAPKFPRPSTMNFLFRYSRRTGNPTAKDMCLFTLDQMAAGGMYDHLGGGFHRYSVDPYWRVPHFEKMLYDQAQLANSYLDAYQITRQDKYREIVQHTLDYVLRDMTSPEGGFYSAEDADSAPDAAHPDHKVEGAFYMWTTTELETLLGKHDAKVFAYAFGVSRDGNTLSDPHGEFGNRNVLYAAHTAAEVAKQFKMTESEAKTLLQSCKQKLLQARAKRPRPALDDKIITAWNGLMISAFARAGAILGDDRYLQAARKSTDFILAHLCDDKTHKLWRRYRDGEARFPAHLDDYAFLTNGLIDLYEASAHFLYLQEAADLAQTMVDLFLDEQNGSFFDASSDSKELLFRSKEFYDGAEPAGNSMAILALLRLGRMLDQKDFLAKAERALRSCIPVIQKAPAAYPQLAVAVDFALDKPMQIVLAGKPLGKDQQDLLAEINRRYLPNRVILYADGDAGQQWLANQLPFISGMKMLDGKPAAYVCENFACELPTSDPKVLAKLLQQGNSN